MKIEVKNLKATLDYRWMGLGSLSITIDCEMFDKPTNIFSQSINGNKEDFKELVEISKSILNDQNKAILYTSHESLGPLAKFKLKYLKKEAPIIVVDEVSKIEASYLSTVTNINVSGDDFGRLRVDYPESYTDSKTGLSIGWESREWVQQ